MVVVLVDASVWLLLVVLAALGLGTLARRADRLDARRTRQAVRARAILRHRRGGRAARAGRPGGPTVSWHTRGLFHTPRKAPGAPSQQRPSA